MEAKTSRMSQSSKSGQPAGKAASKASISPSQMSERTRMNQTAKDPLDALSRVRGPATDRRSGLQDVDDEYLKTVVYAFAKQTSQTAAERAKVTADMIPAGVPTLRSQARTNANAEKRLAAGGEAPAAVATPASPASTVAVASSVTKPAKQDPSANQTQSQAPVQNQAQVQQSQAAPPVQQQQQQPAKEANAAAKTECATPQTCGATPQQRQGGGGEPELYTTCPNCRATLYLVRNSGEPSPYANQQGDAAQQQAPASAQAQPQSQAQA